MRAKRHAFTLIELLVVVAIITTLIAILLPSLGRAKHLAKLTVCGTQLQQIGVGLTTYTTAFRGYYPHREARLWNSYFKPAAITWDTSDIRPMVKKYLDINGLFNCPLQEAFDYEVETDTAVLTSYHLFAGFGYHGETAMVKYGDAMSFQGRRYRVLAADKMVSINDGRRDYGTHPAPGQVEYGDRSWSFSGFTWTQGGWAGDYPTSGPGIDLNFLYDDGSVRRVSGLLPYDDRLSPIPEFAPGYEYPTVATFLPTN